MKGRNLISGMLLVYLLAGCTLIDEDMRNCEVASAVSYQLQLVTNMELELQTQLGLTSDASVRDAIRQRLSTVFLDKAHDVDLSFYDVGENGTRQHHEKQVMDASQSYFELRIKVQKYMHLAVANLEENENVFLVDDENCATASLSQPVADTLKSQTCGIFTARVPMDIQSNVDQEFEVPLRMSNCVSALLLESQGGDFKEIKVFAKGFANGIILADSTYVYNYSPLVEAEKLDVGSSAFCFMTVTFPSRDIPSSKALVSTDDPFVSEVAEEALWSYYVYVTLPDGSVTETQLGVRLPLRPGQFKLIKGVIDGSGSVVPLAPYVGASVTLNWSDLPAWDVTL